jgi:phytanoyl-CoA hydroxylase
MGLNLEEIAADFARDGFVNAAGVLSAAELEDCRRDVERFADEHIRQQPAPDRRALPSFSELGHDADTRHFRMAAIQLVSEPFARLVRNPAIARIAAELMQAQSVQLWADSIQYKPPVEGGPVNWHQDGPRHRGVTPADRLVTAWVSLDDADEKSGCMWMAPGSHMWGDRMKHLSRFKGLRELRDLAAIDPPADVAHDWRGAAPCATKAGDVHFHHAYTWHASPINRSAKLRRGYTVFYMPDGIRVQHATSAHAPALPDGALMSDHNSAKHPIVFERRADSVTRD